MSSPTLTALGSDDDFDAWTTEFTGSPTGTPPPLPPIPPDPDFSPGYNRAAERRSWQAFVDAEAFGINRHRSNERGLS
jgi:hypothetical protein